MKKCPNGMYSEIKYDGERVQLHMKDGKFQFYSRSLKSVQKHKVASVNFAIMFLVGPISKKQPEKRLFM